MMSDIIQKQIEESIKGYDGSFDCAFNKLGSCDFESLIGFGELLDRLSIVNFKLFVLKDKVIQRQDNKDFCAWASAEDVKLCLERSRLKSCIDKKISALIMKIKLTGRDGLNQETKLYE